MYKDIKALEGYSILKNFERVDNAELEVGEPNKDSHKKFQPAYTAGYGLNMRSRPR